jgi:uncharacterized protein YdeI (BOF family)
VGIDDKLWRETSADQNDRIEITGEVDREFASIKIEASKIKKIG